MQHTAENNKLVVSNPNLCYCRSIPSCHKQIMESLADHMLLVHMANVLQRDVRMLAHCSKNSALPVKNIWSVKFNDIPVVYHTYTII